jgi:hypothetical protein
MQPVIALAGDLTAEWLSAALGRTVRGFLAEQVGAGQMGSSWRLGLSYEGEPGPASVVAKLAGGDDAARAQMSIGFRKEVGFYSHLASTLQVRAPHCFYSAISDDGANFTLLLEDLAPARPGVQADSCGFEQAADAVRNLAALHSSRWNDSSLCGHEFLTATEQFVSRYAADVGDDDATTLRAAAEAIVPWFLGRPKPFAVVHGDYRLDNLMFFPNGESVAALDWQSVGVAPPGRDLAYFVGTTFDPPERRLHEDALIGTYHDALVSRGVRGYSLSRCTEDYRAGHLQGPMITVLGAIYATAERSDAADRMFLAMARRSCAAIRDLGSLDLVGPAPTP